MSSDDWYRSPPSKVDINKLVKRFPKHRYCHMCIRTSEKNFLFTGLYCKEHNHLYTWINCDQSDWLINMGIEDQRKY
jgi:hypothetical protein